MKNLYLIIVLACLSVTPTLADFNDGVYAYARGEYDQAFNTMRSLAETSDHGLAQYYVGMMYLRGNAVAQNYEESGRNGSANQRSSASNKPNTGWRNFIRKAGEYRKIMNTLMPGIG